MRLDTLEDLPGEIKEPLVIGRAPLGLKRHHFGFLVFNKINDSEAFRRPPVKHLKGVTIGGELEMIVDRLLVHRLIGSLKFHDGYSL